MVTENNLCLLNGRQIKTYTLSNARNTEVVLTNFGATMLNLYVTDVKGVRRDVILGYRSLESYFDNGEYIGCIVAPSANRIATASFELDGTLYPLDANDGTNNLHTHHQLGANKCIMNSEIHDQSVTFSTHFEDGLAGMPGNRDFSVTFTLDDDNRLKLEYRMISDKKTLFNPTEHSYFNLNGHASGSVFNHELQIDADAFTPVAAGSIPTGEIRAVEESVFDFRTAKPIGRDFSLTDEQLGLTLGYDHNLVLNHPANEVTYFATLKGDESGISMRCYTDLPGVQIYSSNYLNRDDGKEEARYQPHDGLCLETQYYPDNVHHANFPSAVIEANREVIHTTIFEFSTAE